MKFNEGAFSGLRHYQLKNKEVYVTDRHQYTLPIWTAYSNDRNHSYTLVSIDFHPDTNPPFWQEITLKMSMDNREEEDAYFQELLDRRINQLDRHDLDDIVSCTDRLNNDEHINTAMSLGVLKDYHMINCMDAHLYETGRHYLLSDDYYGLLEDAMFDSVGFKVPDKPFILDIDLDYFMRRSDFNIKEDSIFKALVEGADLITVARSVKYFEYLKKEDFTIEACEALLIDLLASYDK